MKILIFVILGIIILGLGYLFGAPCNNLPQFSVFQYFYNWRCGGEKIVKEPNTPTIPGITSTSGLNEPTPQTPQIPTQNEQIKPVSNKKFVNYIPTTNNEIIAIDELGQIIKIKNEQEEILNNTIQSYPQGISFSPDGSKIALKYNNFWSVFDAQTKNWRQLPENISDLAISQNNEVVYFLKNNSEYSIYKLDLQKEKSSPVKLISLNVLDAKLLWKDNENILIFSKPSSLATGYVLLFNIKNKTIEKKYELGSLDFGWDWNTNNGLLFYSDQFGTIGGFFLVKKDFNIQKLSFLTLPEKCTFSTSQEGGILFCGVPRNQTKLTQQSLIDDYLTYDLYTEDDIYKINLADGLSEKIFSNPNKYFDVFNPKISGNKLFFINRFDGLLYQVNL